MNEMVTGQDIVPMDLLQRAIASGTDPVVWEKLMGLEERWQANQARKAFDHALAAAKAEFGEIKKSKTATFTTKMGKTSYNYEDLKDIERAVGPALSKYGMYYRWGTSVAGNDQIIITCIVSHRDGHSVENSLPGVADNSGGKNAVQATGSVCTYLQRYTLKAALGLAADDDDDGHGAGKGTDESSGAAYADRWHKTIIPTATSHEELAMQWNADIKLRGQLEWRGATLAHLKDAVTRRIEQLKPKDKPPSDVATQRLEAEDA